MAKIRIIQLEKIDGEAEEKVRFYQKDGQTVQVSVGIPVTLTEDLFWVADLAKKVGDIDRYQEFNVND